jgi:hypothetical protein
MDGVPAMGDSEVPTGRARTIARALGIVDIVRRHLSPAQTAGWILLVVLLPLVGTLVYFLLRKPTEEEIVRAQAAAAARRDSSSSVHQRLPGD